MLNKKSDQGSVDIKKMTVPELKDLLDRQNKLINNSKFIEKLPDKGKKIKSFTEKVKFEIEAKNSLHDTCDLMSRMMLNRIPNEIEWSGKTDINNKKEDNNGCDSDDDADPLRLVATHSGTIKSYTKKVEIEQPSLVTNKDIDDSKSLKSFPSYAHKLCEKYNKNLAADRFKPHEPKEKSLAKDGYKSSSEHVREKLGKHWEITAATPPIPIHGSTEMVSLSDSLLLQEQQARRLKEIQLQEAMSRLRGTSSHFIESESSLPTTNLMKYRRPVDPTVLFEGTPVSSRCEDNTTEVEGPETDSAVFFNIVDDEL